MWQQIELALRQSAQSVLVKLARFLPGLLALLLAVIVLTAIGAGVAALLRRILTAAKFDERLARNSTGPLSDWSPANSPTALISRVAFWACVLIGCFIGISAFDAAYPGDSQISTFIIPYLTHSIGAVLLLIAGTVIARFLERSVLIGAVNAKLQYARFLSLGIKWLVLVLTAAIGPRPPPDRRNRRRTRLWHPLRRNRPHAGPRRRPRLTRHRQSLARTQRRPPLPHRSHPRRPRLQVPNTPGDPTPLLTSATNTQYSGPDSKDRCVA